MFDLPALRAETPGCGDRIHLNHAGSSLMSAATLAAMTRRLEREAVHGIVEISGETNQEIEAGRQEAATLLKASPAEIAFTTGNSIGYGRAVAALPVWQPGDRILVGRQEWGGNLALLHRRAAASGASIETIPCREDGSVDPQALANLLDGRVRLVSIVWAPANGGLVNDAAAIGAVLKGNGIVYAVDAAQAIGQIPADVTEIGCDILTAPGRKYLRGPRGTGILYLKQSLLPTLSPAYVDALSAPWVENGPVLRQDARLLETADSPTAALCGLAEALRQVNEIGVSAIRQRIAALAAGLRDGLAAIPGVTVQDLGDPARQSGLVSFTLDGKSPGEVQANLTTRGISTAVNGVAYTPLDMQARGLNDIIRASVSHLNTEAEIARTLSVLDDLEQ